MARRAVGRTSAAVTAPASVVLSAGAGSASEARRRRRPLPTGHRRLRRRRRLGYDLVHLGGGVAAFGVGDVIGTGLEAATVMGQVRNAVRSLAVLDRAAGAVLVVSDGLVEAPSRPLTEGLALLAATAAEIGPDDVEVLCDGLLARLLGDERHHDVCVLAVRRL